MPKAKEIAEDYLVLQERYFLKSELDSKGIQVEEIGGPVILANWPMAGI